MKKSEILKIATILYHVIALGMLFTGLSLILDLIFRGIEILGIDSQNSFTATSEGIFAILASILGIIGIVLIIADWINNKRLKFYLGTTLLAESILLMGIGLLLILS